MRSTGILSLALLALPASAVAQDHSEQRARWERAQASDHQFRRRQFDQAGFPRIEDVQTPDRPVRRLLLRDPYGALPVPGVEVERRGDGQVLLRLQYQGWSSDRIAIDRGAWDELASIESAAFARPTFAPAQSVAQQPPSGPCHGWSASLQADAERTSGWTECGGGDRGAAYDYAMRLVTLAMATRPACTFAPDNPFWSFNRCFAPPNGLADPELQVAYATLLREYEAVRSAEERLEAQRVVHSAPLTLGSPAWRDARAAIFRAGEVNRQHRELARRLDQLSLSAPDASPHDRNMLNQTLREWMSALDAEQRYYANLLEILVSASAE